MWKVIREEMTTVALIIIYPILSMLLFWHAKRGRKSTLIIKDNRASIISSETLRTALRDPGKASND